MSNLVQYGSSDSESENEKGFSASEDEVVQEEETLASKRQKLAIANSKLNSNQDKLLPEPQRTHPSESDQVNQEGAPASISFKVDKNDPNSIASFLPDPKNDNKRHTKRKNEESDYENSDPKANLQNRVLGGAIKNQFNGAGIVNLYNDDNNGSSYNGVGDGVEDEVVSSRSTLSFLPSSLLRRKKNMANKDSRTSRSIRNDTNGNVSKQTSQSEGESGKDEDGAFLVTNNPLFSNITKSDNTPETIYAQDDGTPVTVDAHTDLDSIPKPPVLDFTTNAPLPQTSTSSSASKPETDTATTYTSRKRDHRIIPQNSKVIEFNMQDFYNHNNEKLRTGELPALASDAGTGRATVRAFNAYGKNQLASLVRYANDEENSGLLQEKFKREKENKQSTRKKYGW